MSVPVRYLSAELESLSWREVLQQKFGVALYRDWFQTLELLHLEEGCATFSVASAFVREWIETHYMDKLQHLMGQTLKGCTRLVLEVADLGSEVSSAKQSISIVQGEAFREPISAFSSSSSLYTGDILSAPLDPRMTFENFVVGKPNEFAYAAAQRIAESTETVYNPLFLYGPVGHGKTHLLHSIAHKLLKNSEGRCNILYLTAEKFMYHFIKALRYKTIMAFKERFRSVDVLLIDDVQFMSGKESTQEEFFHTFNALVDQKHQLVISADKSPKDLDGLQERMKSRLGWGLVADLHVSTYELRLGILQNKAIQTGLSIAKEILEWLASKITSNIRELEGALIRVAAHASLVGREINLPMVSEVLKDLLRTQDAEITLADIQKCVIDHYPVRLTDLVSAKRARQIVRPRQVAMFLAKQLTTLSLPSIGRAFGGRDHTTVIHAIQTIQTLMLRDPVLREDVALLRRSLENG